MFTAIVLSFIFSGLAVVPPVSAGAVSVCFLPSRMGMAGSTPVVRLECFMVALLSAFDRAVLCWAALLANIAKRLKL